MAFAFLAGVGLAWCAPAFAHGAVFGSFDLVLHFGLGAGIFPGVHNAVSGDTARQDAVWTILNWRAVHAGHLPLWDPDVLLGLPEWANLQSAPLSLPSLVAYLLPLRLAYGGTVLVKLVVGGTGCYAAARSLGTSRTAASLAGVVGEVAGPMAGWAGWPQSGVAEWTGWLLAATVLVSRRPSAGHLAALAAVVALAAAGGFPELLVVLGAAGVLVSVALLAGRRGGLRRAAGLATAVALGGLLSAPAWLPGVPVLSRSVLLGRVTSNLPAGEPWLFLDPSYWGLPTSGSVWFGPSNYYETAAFVGPAVLALALLGLAARRDRRAVGLAVAAGAVLLLGSGFAPVAALEGATPGLGAVAFGRGLLVCCDLLGVLAALGLDEVRTGDGRLAAACWGAAAVPLALVAASTLPRASLPAAERAARLDGAALAAVGMGALLLLVLARLVAPAARRRLLGRALVLGVVGAEAASLVAASAGTSTWSAAFLPTNPAIEAAVRDAGGGLVALGGQHQPFHSVDLGLLANLNAAYGLRELAGYDGSLPRSLERAWAAAAPAPDLARREIAGNLTSFVPDVTTLAEASALGVGMLLEPARAPVRLVAGAGRDVAAALAAAGDRSPAAATGVLDAMEWLTEQPVLLHDYPVARPGAFGDYLAAAAASTLAAAPPTPHVREGAAAAVGLLGRDPGLGARLLACYTAAPPSGAVKVATIDGEVLYRFPAVSGAAFEQPDVGQVLEPLRYDDDATASLTVRARRPGWIRVAVDAEPGWRASAGGKPLPTGTAEGGAVLAVRVPAGSQRVVLSYFPAGLAAGTWMALAAAAAGAAALGGLRRRRSRRGRRGEPDAAGAAPPEGRASGLVATSPVASSPVASSPVASSP